MIPQKVSENLSLLASALADDPMLGDLLAAYWLSRGQDQDAALAEGEERAALLIDRSLPSFTKSQNLAARLKDTLESPSGEIVILWCAANIARGDIALAPLLSLAGKIDRYREQVQNLAVARLLEGPRIDALTCAPLMPARGQLAEEEWAQIHARLEILIWDAGASATQVPELGSWLWSDRAAFQDLVVEPASGSLRGRVLAARCLEITVTSLPWMERQALFGEVQQILQPLLLHPDPLVSTHASRAFGLLAGHVIHMESTLLDWLGEESQVKRQRAITAFVCLPKGRLKALGHELTNVLDGAGFGSGALAAAAAGTPYLFHEDRERFDDIFHRIVKSEGGPQAALELAKGLAALWRRGEKLEQLRPTLSELRLLSRRVAPQDIDELRLWLQVLAVTDPIDQAERDPLDLETGLENLVHQAALYDDEEADARAARFAGMLSQTFKTAKEYSLGSDVRMQAAGMNALESCARSLALQLWSPQLRTHPRGDAVEAPSLEEAWETIARSPNGLLDSVKDRRDESKAETLDSVTLEVLAVKVGAYALDACGSDVKLGPGKGPTAHQTCIWLSRIAGVADGSRHLPDSLRAALSGVFWRLVDTTRGTSLGAVDDIEWLGPFAAWWALVIAQPAMLLQLGNALPLIRAGALERCCELAHGMRATMRDGSYDGSWAPQVNQVLTDLNAAETELADAIAGVGRSLTAYANISGRSENLNELCLDLVLSAERLQAALADPVKALHPAQPLGHDSLSRAITENAPKTAEVLSRAVKTREPALFDIWLTSLGPITSGLVEAALGEAIVRTPPPPPSRKKAQLQNIGGYELVKQLGEGGIGKVWLVRKPGADRLFVLKIPKAEALERASDTERAGILESFSEEAKAMAGLYHPNIANIIDRGITDEVPYLVMELYKGADLAQYSDARRLQFSELGQMVLDSCAGLAALHSAQLVHRDIKPGNIWLRLPLSGETPFDPVEHRDPLKMRPLSAVVIDFGMVRPMNVAKEASGKFVAGTPGYIAPDQVLDPEVLDGRADVYSLAATIYNITTGRTFFDEIETARERIFAHMKQDPLSDVSLLKDWPPQLVKLMRAATALDPNDRPHAMEFGHAFDAALRAGG